MTAFPDELDSRWRTRLRSAVLKWYAAKGRKLPWRESADPYRVWVSEIMLQQTTIATAIPYFERFTDRFPSVSDLAAADQADVLRLWEGLGYYSRARNLHKAANVITREFGGAFPATVGELLELPGIGRYTAAAVASFAFGQAVGIVEANTLRLYSRLISLRSDPRNTAGQRTLWKFSDWIVAPKRPGDFNQAVMDLGAQVCRPVDPDCHACPLKTCCTAFSAGLQQTIPVAARKPEVTCVTEVAVAIRRRGRYLLRQRTEAERWAGLWDFVRFEVADDDVADLQLPARAPRSRKVSPHQKSLFTERATAHQRLTAAIADRLGELTGLRVAHVNPVMEVTHAVTRYRIRLLCLLVESVSGRVRNASGYKWVPAAQLSELPLSTTGRKFAERLTSQ